MIVLFPGVVATRTLAGDWSAISAKPLNQRGLEGLLHFPEGTGAGAEWECVAAEVWTAEGQQAPAVQEVLGVSEAAGAVTAVGLEVAEAWTGEASVVLDEEVPLWTEWAAEVEEEWAHQVERWICGKTKCSGYKGCFKI